MTESELREWEVIRCKLDMQRCRIFLKEWPRTVRIVWARKTREESWGISPNGINGKRNCRWRKMVRTTMWWNRRKWEKWRKDESRFCEKRLAKNEFVRGLYRKDHRGQNIR